MSKSAARYINGVCSVILIGIKCMQKVATVIRRIDRGYRVKIIKGQPGHDRIELRRAWSPLKKVVSLSQYEMALVEVALSARNHQQVVASAPAL